MTQVPGKLFSVGIINVPKSYYYISGCVYKVNDAIYCAMSLMVQQCCIVWIKADLSKTQDIRGGSADYRIASFQSCLSPNVPKLRQCFLQNNYFITNNLALHSIISGCRYECLNSVYVDVWLSGYCALQGTMSGSSLIVWWTLTHSHSSLMSHI